jgi:biopolymer transport protein ExbD
VRSRLGGWLGIAFVAAGLGFSAYSRYWLAIHTDAALDIPVSLNRGHIRTGQFSIRDDEPHSVDVLFAVNGTASCDVVSGHEAIRTIWSASRNGKPIPKPSGKIFPTSGCNLGFLTGGPGRYELDIEVVSDTAPFDAMQPRLHIELAYWRDYNDYTEAADYLLGFGIFLATIGASVLLLSRFGPDARWPQDRALNISPPRANRLRIHRRDYVLLDPGSTTPLVGYVYAVSFMVVFLVNAPFYLATWFYSSGLPARLVQPGVILAAIDGEKGLLVYVDHSGKLYFNSTPITAEELPTALEAELAPRADHSVYVEGDPDVNYGNVVQAMNLVRGAGGEVIMMTPKFRAETSEKHP